MRSAGGVRARGFTEHVGRLLGADPGVFGPFVHAYARIVRRRSRMRLSRGVSPRAMARLSPFHMACILAGILGLAVAMVLVTIRPLVLGMVASITFGMFFVAFAVLFDYLEVLSSSDEYRVIAAHPHDAWSVMSAKIFVVARAVATIAACYFTPSIVAAGLLYRSPAAAAAYALSATLGAAAVSSGAMLLGVWILKRWGRVALLRFLPAVQVVFLVAYVAVSMGWRWIPAGGYSLGPGLPSWSTLLPSVWFLAPLEWATGIATPATGIRAALAVGSLLGLAVVGGRWQRSGFGETLLAMGDKATPARIRRKRGGRRRWIRDPAVRVFLFMVRVHARADLAFRSQLVMSVFMPAMMFLSPSVAMGTHRQAAPELALALVVVATGFAIMGLTTASTTSSRPEALWPVLTSPLARERYAHALRGVLRWGLVAPAAVLVGGWYLAAASAVPWHERIARVLGVAVYLELLVALQRGMLPDPPFTVRPNRDRRLQWSQVAAMLIGFAISAGGGLGLVLLWLIRGWGSWLGLGVLLFWRLPIEVWTRRRVRRAWEAFEPV